MNRYILLIVIPTLVWLAGAAAFAQIGTIEPQTDVAYWANYWSRPPLILFGPEQEAFYQNVQVILFPNDDHDDPSNPNAIDNNVRWLQDHPNVHFYVDGYASSNGDWLYNLGLAQRRADWVKQALISRGIAEDRIKVSAGWGELYPACPETNDECWSKNRVVRLVYSPD
jgi:outer membrane protein OmpA-like peptidoglycan-associated protein